MRLDSIVATRDARGREGKQLDGMDDATYRKHVPEACDSYIVFDWSQIMLTLGRSTRRWCQRAPAPCLARPLRRGSRAPQEGAAPICPSTDAVAVPRGSLG